MDRSLSHLEKPGSTVRIMFFDFSSAFSTIQPSTTNHLTAIYRNSLMTLLSSASSERGTSEPTENSSETLWTGASRTTSSSMQGRPMSWWWISAGTNNPAHRRTSWERTLRRRHLTSTWESSWTINWIGLITLQQHIRKIRAAYICWGSSGPLECMGTSWQPSMTLC